MCVPECSVITSIAEAPVRDSGASRSWRRCRVRITPGSCAGHTGAPAKRGCSRSYARASRSASSRLTRPPGSRARASPATRVSAAIASTYERVEHVSRVCGPEGAAPLDAECGEPTLCARVPSARRGLWRPPRRCCSCPQAYPAFKPGKRPPIYQPCGFAARSPCSPAARRRADRLRRQRARLDPASAPRRSASPTRRAARPRVDPGRRRQGRAPRPAS